MIRNTSPLATVASVVIGSPLAAQYAAGQTSPNIRIVSHVPLAGATKGV